MRTQAFRAQCRSLAAKPPQPAWALSEHSTSSPHVAERLVLICRLLPLPAGGAVPEQPAGAPAQRQPEPAQAAAGDQDRAAGVLQAAQRLAAAAVPGGGARGMGRLGGLNAQRLVTHTFAGCSRGVSGFLFSSLNFKNLKQFIE